ncbi:hypothetical protein D3C85_1788560 [compost metagenome]
MPQNDRFRLQYGYLLLIRPEDNLQEAFFCFYQNRLLGYDAFFQPALAMMIVPRFARVDEGCCTP